MGRGRRIPNRKPNRPVSRIRPKIAFHLHSACILVPLLHFSCLTLSPSQQCSIRVSLFRTRAASHNLRSFSLSETLVAHTRLNSYTLIQAPTDLVDFRASKQDKIKKALHPFSQFCLSFAKSSFSQFPCSTFHFFSFSLFLSFLSLFLFPMSSPQFFFC